MTKRKFIIILLLLASVSVWSQKERDSLLAIIDKQKRDTTEVNALAILANKHANADSAFTYVQKGLLLSEKLNYKKGKADCLLVLALIFIRQLNMSGTIQYGLASLNIYEEIQNSEGIVSTKGFLQAAYRNIGDYQNSLLHAFSGLQTAEKSNAKGTVMFTGHRQVPLFLAEIAQTYLLKEQLDSALYYTQQSISYHELFNDAEWNFPIYLLATIETKQGNYQSALRNYRSALPLAVKNEFFSDTLQIFAGMADLFMNTSELDSAIHYAEMVERSENPNRELPVWLNAVTTLKQSYKIKQVKDSALKYTELSYILKDSLLGTEKTREIQGFSFNERLKAQELIAAEEKYKRKIQLYALVLGMFIVLLIAGILWRNNLQKQKAKIKIENAYSELKSTQAQLIQSEKMASLGEMTAGIAHEIQNPLNFVNNFSEVCNEMIDEMNAQLNKGDTGEAKLIAAEIKQNLEKINHHGKRADAIVKSMLQHSRGSNAKKELTDINALADEYLRLAYHGMRAKDKFFDATTKTDFDDNIGKINIVPQDMGKVMLNLMNNAFYAVDEKKKTMPPSPKGEAGKSSMDYDPIVTVTTKRLGSPLGDRGKIEIRVVDNGNGIPQKVLDKIFQPFFTTKQTGQGTGLGLSLAYDIVKAHGGELKVNTKENNGTEFIIELPHHL